MESRLSIILLSMLPFLFHAQETERDLHGMLLAQPTIAPSFSTDYGLMNSYFHATLEYFPESRLSLRTDGQYFLSTQGNEQPFQFSHKMFLGIAYHHVVKDASFYAVFQPGAAYSKQNPYTYRDSLVASPPLRVSPLIGVTIGANYYFWKIFNLFAAVNYNYGQYIPEYGKARSLGEIRISAGLGWNFRVYNPKKKN